MMTLLFALGWVVSLHGIMVAFFNAAFIMFGERKAYVSWQNVLWASVGIVYILWRLGVNL